jgi:hypothetical protein
MEIKIIKEITNNKDIHITFYVDNDEQSEFYIGPGVDRNIILNAIVDMLQKTIEALLIYR